jgi:histone H3/H4
MNLENNVKNPDLLAEAQALALSNAEQLVETSTKPSFQLERRVNRGGRPKGSFSARENPLKKELHKEGLEIVRACITAAKNGNVSAQSLLINRLLPQGRLIKLRLPKVRTSADAVQVLATILELASNGVITSAEAADFSSLARSLIEATTMQEVLNRLEALEQRVKQ